MRDINFYIDQLTQYAVAYAPKLLLALVVLLIGWWIINRFTHFVRANLQKRLKTEDSIQSFLSSVAGVGLKVLLLISVAGIVGVETASFVGIIAALSFAIGLALQGNLSNFAAGLMILLMKPFKVGDEVKIQGFWAYVKEIQIFHTVLQNFDKTEVILPNSVIMSGTIQNNSASEIRKVKVTLSVPYSEDLGAIKEMVTAAAFSVPEVDSSQPPFFWIREFADYHIKVNMQFPTTLDGFWGTDVKVRTAIVNAFKKNNVSVTYPIGYAQGKYGVKDDNINSVVVEGETPPGS